jgi:hypothetical protein
MQQDLAGIEAAAQAISRAGDSQNHTARGIDRITAHHDGGVSGVPLYRLRCEGEHVLAEGDFGLKGDAPVVETVAQPVQRGAQTLARLWLSHLEPQQGGQLASRMRLWRLKDEVGQQGSGFIRP